MADIIFNGVKDYGFMNNSHFIIQAIIKGTELGLNSIREYLEGCFYIAQHIFYSKTQRSIKDEMMRETPSMGEYARIFTEISIEESKIKRELLDETKVLQPLTLQYMDLPYIFTQS